jgi:hypothetical protein
VVGLADRCDSATAPLRAASGHFAFFALLLSAGTISMASARA